MIRLPHVVIRGCFAIGFLLLVGCGAGQQKPMVDPAAPLTLIDTNPFIPVQERDDKTGLVIPYEASINPYEAQSGRINKEAVTKFIDARRLMKAKRYQQADAMFDDIITLDDDLSGPWVLKGEIAEAQKDHERAAAHYRQAIDTNKRNVNAYLKLAKLQRVQGQFIEAQNTYAEALTVWPDFPEAHLNLGILYDIYLNHPLRAQKHMQAYQFLTNDQNRQVSTWIEEIQSRTGVKTPLFVQAQEIREESSEQRN